MAYLTVIIDDRGRELARLVGTHDRYRFADGSTMFVHTRPAWCHDCRAFAMAEELISPDDLEAQARAFFAMRTKNRLLPATIVTPTEQDAMHRKLLEKFLEEARQWRVALRDRVSPARCLECAGTNYVVVPSDESGIAYPADPHRTIRAECNSHVSMASRGRLNDTEGRYLGNAGDHEPCCD
jgi:hypothetical protein